MSLHIIILAAGQSKRMHSRQPKVLHQLAGKSLLEHVLSTAKTLMPEKLYVVYGRTNQQLPEHFKHHVIDWVYQAEPLGTGHAVMQVLPLIPNNTHVLILYADVPLIQRTTLELLIQSTRKYDALTLLTAILPNPSGLGRIIRDTHGTIQAIIEEKETDEKQRQIKEIYSGVCCIPSHDLNQWVPFLKKENAQGEYYLTDIIKIASAQQSSIAAIEVKDPYEIQGINNRLQLQTLERIYQQRQAEQLMGEGVSIADAKRIDIRGELHCEKDIFIDINCVFIGKVYLSEGCSIEPNCLLKNVTIGKNSVIFANSVLEDCYVGPGCHIGPFARLRSGTHLEQDCKIGNFVETKNARFAEGCKANHLSYLGDVLMGEQVNIGAGTITCNFDGVNKHKTIIGDRVFIGSGTELVAPITVGSDATIGAGSTLRQNAPPKELTLTDKKSKTIYGWKRPQKKSD